MFRNVFENLYGKQNKYAYKRNTRFVFLPFFISCFHYNINVYTQEA